MTEAGCPVGGHQVCILSVVEGVEELSPDVQLPTAAAATSGSYATDLADVLDLGSAAPARVGSVLLTALVRSADLE
jgi:hypothetical protein